MSSTTAAPSTPPHTVGCPSCTGGENETLGSSKSRSLGRRSLDAVRSIRTYSKGRRILDATTNQKIEPPTTNASAESSPTGHSAKQRWYDSIRGRSSQVPNPSSPESMSSTLKRSRFFKSSPVQPHSHEPSISSALQSQAFRTPLPKLDLPSFQAELQRSSVFGAVYDKSEIDLVAKTINMYTGIKPCITSSNSTPKTRAQVTFTDDNDAKTESHATSAIEFEEESEDALHTKCAIYYKGSAWRPEDRQVFSDASSALSHFARQHVSNTRSPYSKILLWTGELPYTRPHTKQTFTVYPHSDGPRRLEIEEKYDLEWALIAFTEHSHATTLPPMKSKSLSEEDSRLMAALKDIIAAGYRVNVWTARDNENWDAEIEYIQDWGMGHTIFQRQSEQEVEERRKRYIAFIEHGIPGFSWTDVRILDDEIHRVEQDEQGDAEEADCGYDYDCDYDGHEYANETLYQSWEQPEHETEGWLMHQEETVTEDADKDQDGWIV
ncbi:hypothetical protein M406DRAFT_66438 [Cryphonectria parasitica EP155]|uniref:Uncharacterized protein n=1 Tax=Cryphonectria parasitica (strain ATCC 38755 / EP155) TaxID=660469 RepID=A0A9P5CSV2_CRYP1|nr:uncharacterized protein M406DRAFT_66438 [Cryphonectria parasitica EP155]KAF3769984.1 hypothetical protein M406DRAFT_66438 [Cryphonectria parasitica EP155]